MKLLSSWGQLRLLFSVYILIMCQPVWSMSCPAVLEQTAVFNRYVKRLILVTPGLSQKIENRKRQIEAVLGKAKDDPNMAFSLIFGVKAKGLKVIRTEFGLYFYGNVEAFEKVYPEFFEMVHGGVMVDVSNKNLLRLGEFAGMVGFGSKSSSEHELEHMLNAMFLDSAYKEFNSVDIDIHRPTHIESMRSIYEKKYRLWAESILKDEILVRVSNGQIHETQTQKASDVFSGPGLVFTSYEPDGLFPYMSSYRSDVKPYGVEPLNRDQAEIFSETERRVLGHIRERWLGVYNQIILEIQAALSRRVSPEDIKLVMVTNSLETVPNLLRKL